MLSAALGRRKFLAGLIQLNCQADMSHNFNQCSSLIREASMKGASIVFTPENTTRLTALDWPMNIETDCHYEHDHPIIAQYQSLAKELSIWLNLGSVPVRSESDKTKLVNRSLLLSSQGSIVARYDKIHLFDTGDAIDQGYKESNRVTSGDEACLVDATSVGLGKIGLTICYDVRFPMLYRDLAMNGADLLVVPAAFTVPTGMAHWHTLLRARAIENGCYVIASAQSGVHTGQRKTFGHSLIVNPWGEIVDEIVEDGPGVRVVEIDLEQCVEARTKIPNLKNQKPFTLKRFDVPNMM